MTVSVYQASVVSWFAVGLAIILTWARLHARYVSPRGFMWDDLLHVLALVFLLIEVSTFFIAVQIAPAIDAFEAGKTDVQPDYAHFQRLLLVWRSMVWSCVWSVKFGYLILYRNIFGTTSKKFHIAWWVVVVFNLLSFVAAVAATFVYCGGSIANLLNEDICDSEGVNMLQYHYLIYGGVLNIVTDLAVMALPLAMLRRIPLSRLQKAGLALIFCLSLAEVVAESVRIAESNPKISHAATNFLVTSLESSVAVWLSCVPSLHYLFQKRAAVRRRESDDERTKTRGGGGMLGGRGVLTWLGSAAAAAGGKGGGRAGGGGGKGRSESTWKSRNASVASTDSTMSTDSFDEHLRKIDQFQAGADNRV